MQCETAEDLIAYAKTEGVELTKEEAEAYMAELEDLELDEENIKKIAGGKDGTRCSNLERRYWGLYGKFQFCSVKISMI